jgi:hypothetical protein
MNAANKKEGFSLGPAGKAGRDVRSLVNLGETASTSRVLNLSQIYLSASGDKLYAQKPFFRDSRLNKCILIKHTLRANELDLFSRPRRTATKILIPFDPSDLRVGAASIFVDQTGFPAFCKGHFRANDDFAANADVEILRLLDSIPSLDPFLVRELLSRHGHKPANCYLQISPSDVQRMIGFANTEIERLVKMAFGETINSASLKLASHILSNELGKELEPLMPTLRLSRAEFSDGIFSWRGFLYFKWRYLELQEEMRGVVEGLAKYQPLGAPDQGIKEYLNEVRPRLGRQIAAAIVNIGRTLGVYDRAYSSLVDRGDPNPFRQFLIDGPSLFYELGEGIAILGHIASFWAYRLKSTNPKDRLHPNDYADILMDFESSLACLTPEE